MESSMIMDRYEAIRAELTDLGLFDDNSLILLRDGRGRVVLDAGRNRVSPDVFGDIRAELAVLTCGEYSKEFSRRGRSVRASNDDMAMMFGCKVRPLHRPHRGTAACLVRNKGFIVSARFPSELIAACILMEKMCKTELLSSRIGEIKYLSPALCTVEHAVYLKKYSRNAQKAAEETEAEIAVPADAAVADISDIDLREEVIKYGRLLVGNRLIQATWGNISVRIDEDRFLITPSGVNYDLIKPEEIVEVRIDDGTYAEGQHPSSERVLHQLVYQGRPDIGAIIHTHSSNCQIFAACHEDLRTDERDYLCADYAVSGSGKLAENVAGVMLVHNGCVMANHGFVAGGRNLEEALYTAISAENAAGDILGAN